MRYVVRTPSGEGSTAVEVLRLSTPAGRTEAFCRRTASWPGKPDVTREFAAVVDANAVRADGEIEFLLPGLVGQSWSVPPRDYQIEALDGEVETPAGKWRGCIVVLYTIAGGDAGFGRRYYGPDVGFVHESCADEADPFEVSLAEVRQR